MLLVGFASDAILKQSTEAVLSTAIIKMCVFWKSVWHPQPNSFWADFISQPVSVLDVSSQSRSCWAVSQTGEKLGVFPFVVTGTMKIVLSKSPHLFWWWWWWRWRVLSNTPKPPIDVEYKATDMDLFFSVHNVSKLASSCFLLTTCHICSRWTTLLFCTSQLSLTCWLWSLDSSPGGKRCTFLTPH